MKKTAKTTKFAFTLYGKEKVLDKTRNVYVRANAKTKYVKYKGEFVKLKEFVKNKNKKIIVKTIKKDGALFFIYKGPKGLKGLKGGGYFENTVKFENDIRVPKENIKDIINKLDDEKNGAKYDNICNFVYTYTIRGKTYHIRPSIIIKKGYNIIIKFFFAYDEWRDPQNQELLWIEIPIHITQFFIDNMIDKRTSKKVSSHIHITSEPDKLLEYNIYAKIDKRGSLIDLRHIYLMAGSISDLILLISRSNYGIFRNWVKYNIGDTNHKHVKFLSYYLYYKKKDWKDFSTLERTDIYVTMNPYIPDTTEKIPDYNITEGISTDLLDCINTKLYRIIIDIFEYIDETKPVDIMIPYEVPSYTLTIAVDNITRHFINDGITHKRVQHIPQPQSQSQSRPQSRPQSSKGKENKHLTQRLTPHSPVKKTTLSKLSKRPSQPLPPSPPKLPR